MSGFEDKFAYAVEVARLRDGRITGTVDELRNNASTVQLQDVLSAHAFAELIARLKKRECTVEDYNNAWADAYLGQVERDEGPANPNWKEWGRRYEK